MRSLQILSNPEEIRFIGNEQAYAILNLIRKKEYSGSGIANVMGMKAPRAIYYLRKLEKLNLAEIVRTEQSRGGIEKYYRATAERFVLYTDVGIVDDDICLSMSNAYLNKMQFSSMEHNINAVLDTIVHDYLNIVEGDRVLIVFYQETIEFMKRLVICMRHVGAEYRIILNSDELSQDQWASMPIGRIESLYNQMSDEIAWSNVCINIGRGSTRPDLSEVPPERVERISDIISSAMSELRNNDRRVLLVHMPLFGKDFMTDSRVLERLRMYWNASSLKKSDFMRMKTINDLLMNNSSITIRTGKHYELDVRFNINNYALSAGPYTEVNFPNTYYIPSGEVSFLPMENGINGDIICETASGISRGISWIRLKIENNIVVDAEAEEGVERLNSLLNSFGIIGRTVSQVCFGLNSEISSVELLPDIGSKMYGSMSISFGNNVALGGNITEPVTWSVVSVSPEVWSGKELILSNNEYHYQY